MAQFKGGKYKDGILSYNYLGGKGKGGVYIKKIRGDWHFVDSKGEVRTNVGIKGKLTPTHIQNLEDDNIFATAKIKPDGTKLSKAIPQGSGPKGGYSAKAGDGAGINSDGALSDGSASVKPNLAESDYSLSGSGGRQMEIGDNKFNSAQLPGKAIGPEGKEFNLAPSEETFEKNYKLAPNYENFDADASNVKGEKGAGGSRFYNPSTVSPHSGIIGANDVSAPGGYNNNITPQINADGLVIGKGGDPGLFEVDDDYYKRADGTLMKDAGWWGKDTVATQADITAGIKDQNDSSWGSATGWNAAGSVMKGVGGLASAYTGIKNYQLARDAHATQQNQWQQNYDQRLTAYKQNTELANQEIQERNRILKSRNPDRTDLYKEL